MNSNTAIVIVLGIVVALLFGVTAMMVPGNEEPAEHVWELSESEAEVAEDVAIDFVVDPDSDFTEGIKTTITNHLDEVIAFGADYELETLIDGTWYRIDVGPVPTIMPLWSAEANGGVFSEEYYVAYYYGIDGQLPSGTYRLVKNVSTGVFEGVDDDVVTYTIAAEFVIE